MLFRSMKTIAGMIDRILSNMDNENRIQAVARQVAELSRQFPLYDVPD